MKTFITLIFLAIGLNACIEGQKNTQNTLASVTPDIDKKIVSKDEQDKFGKYWYNGKAELTSYKLSQARYGEIHEGHAVLIYVTEQFLPKRQLKADNSSKENIPILKLNNTKKFLTGIYPYSLMSSIFSPIDINKSTIKTAFSGQEWCGQTYIQLNNRKKYDIAFHSYFESNGDKNIQLNNDAHLESQVWTTIRISPENLPLGKLKMIPSLEFLGMQHKEIKAYQAKATLEKANGLHLYRIEYPQLKRKLLIKYAQEFPYTIEGWEETTTRYGRTLSSKAEKLKSIRSAYWNKNKVVDVAVRKELGL